MVQRILLPTDGSHGSEVAIPHALSYAARHGATVHALYVVDEQFARNPQARSTLRATGDEALQTIEQRAADAGVAVETAIREGVPHEEILTVIDEQAIDFVVMGTHGRGGLDRLLIGSVTERVVRSTDVPVLTVGGPHGTEPEPPYEQILVPTDGSDAATASLDIAIDVAKAYDATLHVVNVVDLATVGPDVRSALNLDLLEEAGESIVEEAAAKAHAAGLEHVVTSVEIGAPVESILTYIEDHDIDFVAMGTHGRQNLERFLIGSTTDRIIRSTDLPVLSVRSE